MKLELEDRVIDLKLNGESYTLDLPRYNTLKKHLGKIKKLGEDSEEAFELNLKMLIDAGLPEDKAERLQIHQIEQILGALSGETAKKK